MPSRLYTWLLDNLVNVIIALLGIAIVLSLGLLFAAVYFS